jgi:hypothetical protein
MFVFGAVECLAKDRANDCYETDECYETGECYETDDCYETGEMSSNLFYLSFNAIITLSSWAVSNFFRKYAAFCHRKSNHLRRFNQVR